METTDRYIRFDWAINAFTPESQLRVLEGLLTVLLNEKVEIIELLESESNQQTIDDKFNRVDIKAKIVREIIIVEIQNTQELYYLERICMELPKQSPSIFR